MGEAGSVNNADCRPHSRSTESEFVSSGGKNFVCTLKIEKDPDSQEVVGEPLPVSS